MRIIHPTDSFETAMNIACRDLPPGWDIEIRLEKGSGGVVLLYCGEEVPDCPTGDESILDQLNAALAYADTIEDA
jgi:hypothetical protein